MTASPDRYDGRTPIGGSGRTVIGGVGRVPRPDRTPVNGAGRATDAEGSREELGKKLVEPHGGGHTASRCAL